MTDEEKLKLNAPQGEDDYEDSAKTRLRGFEVVSEYAEKGINLPKRHTAHSAAYDIEAAETVDIWPGETARVTTGLKVYMQPSEWLMLAIRSGLGARGIMLANAPGIIDSDFYNNATNEGHFVALIHNAGEEPFKVKKGDRIMQAVFMRYLVADNDQSGGSRNGGLGSTGTR